MRRQGSPDFRLHAVTGSKDIAYPNLDPQMQALKQYPDVFDGKLRYEQKPLFSHCLNSDFYWYEIGDVISIGDNEFTYFCFPKENVSVTKARLATEELYKMKKIRKK